MNATFAETLVSPQPKPLTFDHFPYVDKLTTSALETDPLNRYLMLEESRQDNAFLRGAELVFRNIFRSQYVELNTAWTIDDGDALVCYSDPAKPTPALYTFVESMAERLGPLIRDEEQMKRMQEVRSKLRPAMRELFETHGKNMFCIEHVGTIPAKQGRGYGTTLCKIVTKVADSRSLKTYLVSSNVSDNTTFYNNLGFFSVKTIVLGDDNPTWEEPPFEVEIMVREVPSGSLADK